MKTILKEGIAVNCKTEEEAKEFLAILDKDGYMWGNGKKLIITNWNSYQEKTCYGVALYGESKGINFGTWGKGFCSLAYKLISFAEFKQSLTATITEHLIKGNKTIIKLSNGKVGIANCLPEDKFNEGVGAIIAVAKAYNVDLKEVVKLIEKPKEPKLYYAKDIVGKWAKVKIAGWQDCERKIIFADNKKIVYLYREGNRLGYTEDKEAFGKTWQLI